MTDEEPVAHVAATGVQPLMRVKSEHWHHGIDWTGELQVAPREGQTLEDVIRHNREVVKKHEEEQQQP